MSTRCTSAAALACAALVTACVPTATQRAASLHDARVENPTAAPGEAVEDDRSWQLALFNVHSAEGPWQSRGGSGPSPDENHDPRHARMAMRMAASWGIRTVFITDHNSVGAPVDREVQDYARQLGVSLVTGSEWSLGGPLGLNLPITVGQGGPHLALVGYDARRTRDVIAPKDTRARPTEEMLRAVMKETHDRGGAVVICHPDAPNFDWPDGMGPLHADLVEVDGPLVVNPLAARRRWHQWLMEGHRVGAISGSNWHVAMVHAWPMERVNLVRSRGRAPADLLDAVRAGHVMVVRQPQKVPRVMLGVDADGDGDPNDVREGDVVRPVPGQDRGRVGIRVVGGAGQALLLYGASAREPFLRETLSEDDVIRAVSVKLVPGKRVFVRAELWDGPTLTVLTNPVYFDPATPLAEPAADTAPRAPVVPGESP